MPRVSSPGDERDYLDTYTAAALLVDLHPTGLRSSDPRKEERSPTHHVAERDRAAMLLPAAHQPRMYRHCQPAVLSGEGSHSPEHDCGVPPGVTGHRTRQRSAIPAHPTNRAEKIRDDRIQLARELGGGRDQDNEPSL
jgi:hypothetical protein